MAYSTADLAAVEAAIVELAKGERVVSVTVMGRTIESAQSDMEKLRALRAEIESDVQSVAGPSRFVLTSTSKGLQVHLKILDRNGNRIPAAALGVGACRLGIRTRFITCWG